MAEELGRRGGPSKNLWALRPAEVVASLDEGSKRPSPSIGPRRLPFGRPVAQDHQRDQAVFWPSTSRGSVSTTLLEIEPRLRRCSAQFPQRPEDGDQKERDLIRRQGLVAGALRVFRRARGGPRVPDVCSASWFGGRRGPSPSVRAQSFGLVWGNWSSVWSFTVLEP